MHAHIYIYAQYALRNTLNHQLSGAGTTKANNDHEDDE